MSGKPDSHPRKPAPSERDAAETSLDASLEVRTADVRDVLKRHGLRYSKPREAILEFFGEVDRHVSAEGLYLALKQRGENVSLSTVYLNLSVLTEAGLLREFGGVAGESLYDSNVRPHYHLICRESGEVIDVPDLTVEGVPLGRFLKRKIEQATGWQVDEPQLHLRGVSPAGRRGAGERRSAPSGDPSDPD